MFRLARNLPSPGYLHSPRTWETIAARAGNRNTFPSLSLSLILLFLVFCPTIFNPEIGSASAANLIPTSCPSVIPLTLSAFGQIRLRSHGQFLYANLLITQRKHIGRVRYPPPRVFPFSRPHVCPLHALVFLPFSSSHSANRFQVYPSTLSSGDGNRGKFHALDKITAKMC